MVSKSVCLFEDKAEQKRYLKTKVTEHSAADMASTVVSLQL